MKAGKPVLIEIPMADSLEDSEAICKVQKETGVLAMAGQVRRFNPSHQWIQNRIAAGELKIQQMDVQTYFFRRSNMNAKGEPRSWTDHLLWHHACHTVDLFQYQTGETVSRAFGLEGPHLPVDEEGQRQGGDEEGRGQDDQERVRHGQRSKERKRMKRERVERLSSRP